MVSPFSDILFKPLYARVNSDDTLKLAHTKSSGRQAATFVKIY